MLDYIQNTLFIRIPHISKENLNDEWLRINWAQPVNGSNSLCISPIFMFDPSISSYLI